MPQPQQDNPYEIVEQLNRAMYGDPATRSKGLLDTLDSLTFRLDRLDDKLERMENRRPNVAYWSVGYVLFCVAGIFAVIAVVNQIPRHTILNVPTELAATLAVAGALIALFFFLTGFGWIGGK